MSTLIESTFVTLDGVISAPHEWGPPYWDDEHAAYAQRLLDEAGSLLLGRRTYDAFVSSWPNRAGDPYADQLNAMPKYVASRALSEATWNTTVLGEDIVSEVTRLKQGASGSILKFGTGELDATLLPAGLVDQLVLWVFPVVAGSGDRLLDGLVSPTHLRLVRTTTFASGIVVHTYAPK